MSRRDRTKYIARHVAAACIALIGFEAHAQSDSSRSTSPVLGQRSQYRLIDLGTLGGLAATAYGITNTGHVYGVRRDSHYRDIHVFSWSPREGAVDLLTFEGISAYVSDVSMSGHVVGWSYKGLGGRAAAFITTRAGGLFEIHMPEIEDCTAASAVNNAGRVVGGTCNSRAFSWTEREGVLDLGTLGGPTAWAYEVNDAGQVVGISSLPGGEHAFSWTRLEGMVDLGTLGGSRSNASAVSNRGHVVGSGEVADGSWHAFLWTAKEGMIDLGTLGGRASSATAANDAGAVIGVSDTADSSQHAFFWSPQTGMVDIGTLGGRNSFATGINQVGIVIGTSETLETNEFGPVQHAFAWSLGMGLVDLGAPPRWHSAAHSINARGQIVGQVGMHAVIWEPAATSE